MLTIDGSHGEGGGQILRSSLALAMVTGKPFRIEKIRAGRKKPGLMRQHLTAVRSATEISRATVEGDLIGSTALAFTPSQVSGGEYTFSVGTAGSATLVLQTVLLPLLRAERPSRITLEGGTHNPFAPPFDFLAAAYLPLVNRMGPRVSATLERPGFHPAGGGKVVIEIVPSPEFRGFELVERGPARSRRARAAVAHLPRHIAERELRVIQSHLNFAEDELEIVDARSSVGPGNIVTIELVFEHVAEVFTGFGEVGRPAEAVARQAVDDCQRYLKSTAPVGEYLTDQLLLPLAIAGSGAFVSTGLSRHALTHIELIQEFLDLSIRSERRSTGDSVVRIG